MGKGFTDCLHVPEGNEVFLGQAFPKVAALAGLKKGKKVPKGWISSNRKRGDEFGLSICTGTFVVHKSNAPKSTAHDGHLQHDPYSEPLF